MRTVSFVFSFVIPISCIFAFSVLLAGDDKKDRLDKLLAELERTHEKEERVLKIKQTIADLAKDVAEADRIEAFRLHPEKNSNGKRVFHEYEILAERRVEKVEQRKEVATFLGKALHWNELRMGLCFNPRHGIRATLGKRTVDLLICFECWRVYVYDGEEARASYALLQLEPNVLEAVLREVEKNAK